VHGLTRSRQHDTRDKEFRIAHLHKDFRSGRRSGAFLMEALIVLGLIVAAYWIGRLWQWVIDARRSMGDPPGKKQRG